MKRASMIIAGMLLASLAARDAAAQWNVAAFEAGRGKVYTTFGLDPAFVTSVGLSRVGAMRQHAIQISADVGMVTASMDPEDFRARLGLQTSLVHWRSLHLTGSATAIVRGTDNTVYRAVNIGADATGALGWYRPRWFAAGEFGKDKAIITHLTNSQWYRTNVYADAKDGWYLDAGGTYHFGVSGGATFGRTEIVGKLGLLRTERFNEMTPPAYASIGMGVGF